MRYLTRVLFADISEPASADGKVVLPRLPYKIEGTHEEGFHAVFEFGGEERRIETESGGVSVLTDGRRVRCCRRGTVRIAGSHYENRRGGKRPV